MKRLLKLFFILFASFYLVACKNKTYLVIFDSNGGSEVLNQTIFSGEKAIEPKDPILDGYDFVGWFNDENLWDFNKFVVTKDIILKAKWNKQEIPAEEKFLVEFDSNGGSLVPAQNVIKGEKVVKPDNPIKEGYTCIGWYINDEKWNFSGNSVTSDIILTAYWEINKYTITFDTDGGSRIEPRIFEYNSYIKVPFEVPVKLGYKFIGWEDYPDNMPAKNITLKAIWKKQCKINYYTNGYLSYSDYVDNNTNYVLGSNYGEYGMFFMDKLNDRTYEYGDVMSIGDENYIKIDIDPYLTYFKYSFSETGDINLIKLIDENLVNIELKEYKGKKIVSIGDGAFRFCSNLQNIILNDGLISINNFAFDGCKNLTNIVLPNTLIELSSFSFSGCIKFDSIIIPKSVTIIEDNVFWGCNNLSSIVVENGNSVYDSRNNCNAIIDSMANTLVCGCKNTIIPNDVKNIGYYAFGNCRSLEKIVIPQSVKKIS